MLTQPAERNKLDSAVRLWALIYLVLVERTFQVLVEPHERFERPIAQETLICVPVPRVVGHPMGPMNKQEGMVAMMVRMTRRLSRLRVMWDGHLPDLKRRTRVG